MVEPSLPSYTVHREGGSDHTTAGKLLLVKLQPSSCCHSRKVLWPMKSVVFVDCIHCPGLVITSCSVHVS